MDEDINEVRESFCLIRQGLGCYVCKKIISDPWTTGCGHSFCRKCVETLWLLERQCPKCHFYSVTCRGNKKNDELEEIILQFRKVEEAFKLDTQIDISDDRFQRSFKVDRDVEEHFRKSHQDEDSSQKSKVIVSSEKINNSKNLPRIISEEILRLPYEKYFRNSRHEYLKKHLGEKEDKLEEQRSLKNFDSTREIVNHESEGSWEGIDDEEVEKSLTLKKSAKLPKLMKLSKIIHHERFILNEIESEKENPENASRKRKRSKSSSVDSEITSETLIVNELMQEEIESQKKRKSQVSESETTTEILNLEKLKHNETKGQKKIKSIVTLATQIPNLEELKQKDITGQKKRKSQVSESEMTTEILNLEELKQKEIKIHKKRKSVVTESEMTTEILNLEELKQKEIKIHKKRKSVVTDSEITTEILNLEELKQKEIESQKKRKSAVTDSEITTEILNLEELKQKEMKDQSAKEKVMNIEFHPFSGLDTLLSKRRFDNSEFPIRKFVDQIENSSDREMERLRVSDEDVVEDCSIYVEDVREICEKDKQSQHEESFNVSEEDRLIIDEIEEEEFED